MKIVVAMSFVFCAKWPSRQINVQFYTVFVYLCVCVCVSVRWWKHTYIVLLSVQVVIYWKLQNRFSCVQCSSTLEIPKHHIISGFCWSPSCYVVVKCYTVITSNCYMFTVMPKYCSSVHVKIVHSICDYIKPCTLKCVYAEAFIWQKSRKYAI